MKAIHTINGTLVTIVDVRESLQGIVINDPTGIWKPKTFLKHLDKKQYFPILEWKDFEKMEKAKLLIDEVLQAR